MSITGQMRNLYISLFPNGWFLLMTITEDFFLNSANILIPHVDGMSVKTVMAFLNSEVMQYYYSSLFGDVKVLKSNLLELPFPLMTKSLDNKIVKLVDKVVSGDFSAIQRIQNIIYNVYGLTPSQRRYIHSSNMRNKLL